MGALPGFGLVILTLLQAISEQREYDIAGTPVARFTEVFQMSRCGTLETNFCPCVAGPGSVPEWPDLGWSRR